MASGIFETSHVATCPDVAPECATTEIPAHEHHARLRLTHTELAANYGIRAGMQLALRVPYDVKGMRIRYTTLEGAPFTPPYGDIHHRTETLRGITDPSLSLELAARDHWIVGLGTTLPFGRTEENPIELGRQGREHQHIQFGSGTFRPKLSLQWMNPRFFARAEAQLSLYENPEGYRAPTTVLWSAGPTFRAARIRFEPRLTGQHQTVSRWSGAIDEGSGFNNGGVRMQLSVPAGRFAITPSVYRELWSRGLHDESFAQGTTWGVGVSWIAR